jgi:hypothetical protein
VPTEEIIVLADSKKMGGRCLAGISTRSGEWIRPVSELADGVIYPFHCRVQGRQPRLLDVVRLPYQRRLETPTQPENLLISGEEWSLAGSLEPDVAYAELRPFLDPGPALFGNGQRGVDEEVANQGLAASLALIESDLEPTFVVKGPSQPGGSAQTRATFELGGWCYDLPITDFEIRPRLLMAGAGSHGCAEIGLESGDHILLTISLGLPWNGTHWKLVAGLLAVS